MFQQFLDIIWPRGTLSFHKFFKIGQNEQKWVKVTKIIKFMNFTRVDYVDCAQSPGIYVEKYLSTFLMSHGHRKTRGLLEITKRLPK